MVIYWIKTLIIKILVWRYVKIIGGGRSLVSMHKFNMVFDNEMRMFKGLTLMHGSSSEQLSSGDVLKMCTFGYYKDPKQEELGCQIYEYW